MPQSLSDHSTKGSSVDLDTQKPNKSGPKKNKSKQSCFKFLKDSLGKLITVNTPGVNKYLVKDQNGNLHTPAQQVRVILN